MMFALRPRLNKQQGVNVKY